jgi:hypothetical protein
MNQPTVEVTILDFGSKTRIFLRRIKYTAQKISANDINFCYIETYIHHIFNILTLVTILTLFHPKSTLFFT